MNGSSADDQISVSNFGVPSVLGPTFVRFENASPAATLTVDGRAGDDIVSASTAAMTLTLVGGSGTIVLLGGPGDDTLVGGDGFDDAKGGKGDDVARLGANFDRFSWAPGDGSDTVDGGARRDSLFMQGTNDPEAYGVQRDGKLDRMALTGRVVVAGTATLTGLPATVNISHAEPADTLALDTGAGDDTLDTSAFDPKTIGLEID